MAWIKAYETAARQRGKPVKTYKVIWKEVERDAYGLPLPADPAKPEGRKRTRNRQESFPTREAAEARRDELNAARHTGTTAALADQRKAGDLPFGYHARELFSAMHGTVKPRTVEKAEGVYRRYLADAFGERAIATITAADVRHFRSAMLAPRPRRSYDTRSDSAAQPTNPDGTPQTVVLKHGTVKEAYDVLRRIFDVAVVDGAIKANPVHSVPLPRQSATARTSGQEAAADFAPQPLSGPQVAGVAHHIGTVQLQPAYALAVTFSAYTGLRAGELRGLEIGDVTLPRTPGAMGMVAVSRTKTRRGGQWAVGTPKSVRSTRVVPIDAWLADDLRAYLARHPLRLNPSAPLFPGRMTRAEAKAAGVRQSDLAAGLNGEAIANTYKWTEPMDTSNVARNYYAPAMAACGLPPARWHDLRHTFAVLSLSAGEHYMQVSKWLGHASYVTTLTVYADYISEAEGGKAAPLSRPLATVGGPARQVTALL